MGPKFSIFASVSPKAPLESHQHQLHSSDYQQKVYNYFMALWQFSG